jgi:hypothetical protein
VAVTGRDTGHFSVPGGTAAIGPALAGSALAPATPGTWNLLAGPQTGPAQVKAKLGGPRRTLRPPRAPAATAFAGQSCKPHRSTPPPTAAASPSLCAATQTPGVERVHVMPLAGDPAAFIRSLGDHVIARLP